MTYCGTYLCHIWCVAVKHLFAISNGHKKISYLSAFAREQLSSGV